MKEKLYGVTLLIKKDQEPIDRCNILKSDIYSAVIHICGIGQFSIRATPIIKIKKFPNELRGPHRKYERRMYLDIRLVDSNQNNLGGLEQDIYDFFYNILINWLLVLEEKTDPGSSREESPEDITTYNWKGVEISGKNLLYKRFFIKRISIPVELLAPEKTE